MRCRYCNTELSHVFIDLINSPASNSFLALEQLNEPEIFYPLKVYTCHHCFLVQVDEYKKSGAIFDNNYIYFSSFSKSWLKHAFDYVSAMIHRFNLDQASQVIELASNDGYLLQYFLERGIKVLGIEPTANTAEVAIKKGIRTRIDFFSTALANEMVQQGEQKADLMLGNNVLAHVPDIIDFVNGMKIMLNDLGVITMEFPHLLQLVENNQFDTIYHEHFSYLSLYTVKIIFESQGLAIFDVDELPTHGGSLRIYARHLNDSTKEINSKVNLLLKKEIEAGITTLAYYSDFKTKTLKVKLDLLEFLIKQKRDQIQVAGYGAAAKGNTLLNYCGIKNDLISFVVDASPHKQNKYLPGSHIPVVNEAYLKEQKPEYVLILPWNLVAEITDQLSYIRAWGGKFVLPIPSLQIL